MEESVDAGHWPDAVNAGQTKESMANIAAVLKAEISRVARKEVRAETEAIKKAASSHRSDIAELKRRVQALEQEFRRLGKLTVKVAPQPAEVAGADKLRFSAKGLASQRRRLGLSAEECGLLVGASGQSVYNWEAGGARPRAKLIPAIAALRSMGKKDAAARIAALKDGK